jgi:hypothetical protein
VNNTLTHAEPVRSAQASHPGISVLSTLLPKSVLHPPRISLTLPFPTSSLSVHTGAGGASTGSTSNRTPGTGISQNRNRVQAHPAHSALPAQADEANSANSADQAGAGREPISAPVPVPASSSTRLRPDQLVAGIHYAPIHVKGITTTIPADGAARKAKRLEEVRKRRREVKEGKRLKLGKARREAKVGKVRKIGDGGESTVKAKA